MHHIPSYIRIHIWSVDHTQGVAGEPTHRGGVVVPEFGVVVVEFAVEAMAGVAEGWRHCSKTYVVFEVCWPYPLNMIPTPLRVWMRFTTTSRDVIVF